MKSKFARCAKQQHDKDREDATSFTDEKRIGDVFSQKTANMVQFACHKTPQMHDMRGMSDDMHGAETYVTHAKKPFMNSSKQKSRRREDDLVLLALAAYQISQASSWNNGIGTAAYNYDTPAYH